MKPKTIKANVVLLNSIALQGGAALIAFSDWREGEMYSVLRRCGFLMSGDYDRATGLWRVVVTTDGYRLLRVMDELVSKGYMVWPTVGGVVNPGIVFRVDGDDHCEQLSLFGVSD